MQEKMNKEKLIALYETSSKHSNYQILPNPLNDIIQQNELEVNSRFEQERLNFITSKMDIDGMHMLDIGGNTGFFSFEFINAGAEKVTYYEGNNAHAQFVEYSSRALNFNIDVKNQYLDFTEGSEIQKSDAALFFNVVHHFGDDFGDTEMGVLEAKEQMKQCINFFAAQTSYLIFQMGFCWKGDRHKLLFDGGTKSEMIKFVEEAIAGYWKIEEIGIAEINGDQTVYNDLNDENIERNDALGEFRNRPIFILKSLHI